MFVQFVILFLPVCYDPNVVDLNVIEDVNLSQHQGLIRSNLNFIKRCTYVLHISGSIENLF